MTKAISSEVKFPTGLEKISFREAIISTIQKNLCFFSLELLRLSSNLA